MERHLNEHTEPAELGAPAPSVILFVAVPAALGGSNRSLATMLQAMPSGIHRVLACPGSGSFLDLVTERGIADEHIAIPHGSRWKRILAAIRIAAWVWRRRREVTAVHAQAITGMNLVVPAAIISRVPVVVRITDATGSKWGRLLGPLVRRLLKRVTWSPVSATALSVAVENGLCDPTQAIVIPQPVDPADVQATIRRSRTDVVRIGFLGGTTWRKGFDLVPKVIAGTLDLPVEWFLYMGRHDQPELQETIRVLEGFERVTFAQREVDVRKVYQELDLLFMPSRAESFGRVVVEAMLNGIPVVASDLDPTRSIIGDEEAGLLFPPGDTAAAIRAVRTLVLDPPRRAQMGRAGLERAQSYSPAEIMSRFLSVYGL